MKFAIVGEGKTDHIVLKNLLIGYFNDKNLLVGRPLPEGDEPVGWGNLFKYLSSDRFKAIFEFSDYVVVQIDTGTCEDWKEDIKHIGADSSGIYEFIQKVKTVLIKKIGEQFYSEKMDNILFAICVHDMECWLLPFIGQTQAQYSKAVGCFNALEHILKPRGISLHQKSYHEGKHYDDLSRGMKKQKELMEKSELNPSLKIFIDSLLIAFPPSTPKAQAIEPAT